MTDTLLRVLSNADLNWMMTCGEFQTLAAGDSVLHPCIAPSHLVLVIEGSLAESFAVSGQEAVDTAVLIDELSQGELVGISPLLEAPSVTAVKALKSTTVLSLPLAQLKAKLADDISFAAHFYHAIALLLSDRLRCIFEHPDRIGFWGERSSKAVLTVFSELRDSDIDWLTAFGQVETLPANRVLLQAARPVESLYILLDGQMAMSIPQDTFNPFALCFLRPDPSARNRNAFAILSQGSMPGILSFLDFRPLPVTVRTSTECLVFAVPRPTLVTKLQVDDSFASRFYRVIAMQTLELLQTMSLHLARPNTLVASATGLGQSSALVGAPEDEEELDMDDLQQMSEGAKKFNWMLTQLGVNHHG
jgi:bacteriocin-type transport-associated protein